MSNIHFFLQGKGGIGKTTLSSFAAQYLKSIGKSVECFDTDTVNHSFMQWKELNVKECNICEMNGDVNHHAAEEMIEYLLEECKSENIIIDNGASSFLPMLSYLVENDIISILKGAGHNYKVKNHNSTSTSWSRLLPSVITLPTFIDLYLDRLLRSISLT